MQLAVCQIRPFAEGLTVRDTFVQKTLADLLWKVFSPNVKSSHGTFCVVACRVLG